jgi:hypothetical protein
VRIDIEHSGLGTEAWRHPVVAPSASGSTRLPAALGFFPGLAIGSPLSFMPLLQLISAYGVDNSGFPPARSYPTKKPEGFSGRDLSVWSESSLKALDYQTGQLR